MTPRTRSGAIRTKITQTQKGSHRRVIARTQSGLSEAIIARLHTGSIDRGNPQSHSEARIQIFSRPRNGTLKTSMTQPMDWVIFFGANIAATEPVEGSCARLVVYDVARRIDTLRWRYSGIKALDQTRSDYSMQRLSFCVFAFGRSWTLGGPLRRYLPCMQENALTERPGLGRGGLEEAREWSTRPCGVLAGAVRAC
jgi:hypothetical protein